MGGRRAVVVSVVVVDLLVLLHVHGLGKSNSETQKSLTNRRDGC